jgi:5-methylthioadenosine/S-adenosylhomocysteine deaminase
MKYAGLLQKVTTLDPRALPALESLYMATMAGARALGMDDIIGSLEVGKRADIAIVDMRRLHNTPLHDPVSNLVYSANGSDVSTVMIEGEIVVDEGRLTFLDEQELMVRVQLRAEELAERAGVHRAGTPWLS